MPRLGFRGFSKEKMQEVASKGGKAAHAKGTAHEFDATEAAAAGRKGGLSISADRKHMAKIGRRGGARRQGKEPKDAA